jgi:hypothetical protein
VFSQLSKYQWIGAAVAALVVASWTSSASAVLQGYEGFNYPDTTSILTQTGGGGWTDAWTKNGNEASTEIATAPGLTYSTLPVVGNKATLTGATALTGNGASSFVFRNFNTNFGGDGTTTWLSFIGQRTGTKSGDHGVGSTPSYQRIYGISFFDNGIANTNERFNVGELSSSADVDDTDTWALNVFNPSGPGTVVPTAVPVDQQAFLLVRLDYGSGPLSDNAYLWVNPNLALGQPSIGTANASLLSRNLEFDRLRISAGGSSNANAIPTASGLIDEIRVGTTFASVTSASFVPGIGDVDGDGDVDIDDYEIIRDNFQQPGTSRDDGDLNGDGIANLVDFRIWKDNRNVGPGGGSGTPVEGGNVPEPTGLAILLLGMSLTALTRRRRFAPQR